jgi:hypothetical protein
VLWSAARLYERRGNLAGAISVLRSLADSVANKTFDRSNVYQPGMIDDRLRMTINTLEFRLAERGTPPSVQALKHL